MLTANEDNGRFSKRTYDAFGNKLTEASAAGGVKTTTYDIAGRQTRFAWADGFAVTYGYDAASRMTTISRGDGPRLITIGYDDDGRRSSLCRAGTTTMCTAYGYDADSRLTSLDIKPVTAAVGTSVQLTAYNPADQIGMRTPYNLVSMLADAGDPGAQKIAGWLKADYIDRGRFGVEPGAGFYDYPDPAFLKPDFLTGTA